MALDDWSFIIKTQALVEAALTHLLVHTLNRPELAASLGKLNYKTKMQFVEALDRSLEARDIRFLYAINELRNTVVHDVRNVTFEPKKVCGRSGRSETTGAGSETVQFVLRRRRRNQHTCSRQDIH